MLGIKKYKLNLIGTVESGQKVFEKYFYDLIGQAINSYFVQWNLNENEWNDDAPIILLIGGKQIELTSYQLDFSLTVDRINLTNKLNWYGEGNNLPLEWVKNPFQEINKILYKPIDKIFGIEFGEDENFNLVGFEFEFKGIKDCLCITNGLDCNIIKLHRSTTNKNNKRIQII